MDSYLTFKKKSTFSASFEDWLLRKIKKSLAKVFVEICVKNLKGRMWACFWLLVNTYACVCVSTFGGQGLASVGMSYWTWELTRLMRMIDGWSFQDLPMSLSLPPPRTGAGDWWRTCESSFYRGSHFIDSSIDPAPQRGSGAWVFLFASIFILLSWDTDDSVVSPVHVFKNEATMTIRAVYYWWQMRHWQTLWGQSTYPY